MFQVPCISTYCGYYELQRRLDIDPGLSKTSSAKPRSRSRGWDDGGEARAPVGPHGGFFVDAHYRAAASGACLSLLPRKGSFGRRGDRAVDVLAAVFAKYYSNSIQG